MAGMRERVPLFVVVILSAVLVLEAWGIYGMVAASQGAADVSAQGQDGTGDADADAADVMEATADPTPAQPTSVEIDLTMVGDVLMHGGVYQSGLRDDGTYNFDHVWANVRGSFTGQDLVAANQETPMGGSDLGFSGYPSFNGPQEMGDAEVAAGVNVVLKATNHALDRGYQGVAGELAFWRERHPQVAVLGERDVLAPDPGSLDEPYVFEKDGFRVALLNYTYGLNGIPDPEGAVSLLDEARIRANVARARELGADLVVAFPHWGAEYATTPSDSQRGWAHVFLDAGVDAVVGGHPHVLEPVEVLERDDGHRMVCFWSVGNFVCTQPQDVMMVGGMAQLRLVKDEAGARVAEYALVPLVVHKGAGTDMTTYLLRDYTDDLAATNAGHETLTPGAAQALCQEILGEGYDPAACELRVRLDAAGEQDTAGADAEADALPDAA